MSEYIITRSELNGEGLYHFGIKGQKWGVRRFENADGTLTEEGKKRYNKQLDRQFKKEFRKLGRYEKQADIDLQTKNANKYDQKANTALKIGLLTAGTGAAIAAGGSVANAQLNGLVSRVIKDYGDASLGSIKEYADSVRSAGNENIQFDKNRSYGSGSATIIGQRQLATAKSFDYAIGEAQGKTEKVVADHQSRINSATNMMTNAGKALFLGSAIPFGYAIYSKARSSVAKRRISDIGHEKSVKRYEAHVSDMLKQFGGTKYESAIKERVNAYKEEHPNTKLNSNQIEKMLNGK